MGGFPGSVLRSHHRGNWGGGHSRLPLNSLGFDTITKLHRQRLCQAKGPFLCSRLCQSLKTLPFLKSPLNTFPSSFPLTTLAEVAKLVDFLCLWQTGNWNLKNSCLGVLVETSYCLEWNVPPPFLCQLILNWASSLGSLPSRRSVTTSWRPSTNVAAGWVSSYLPKHLCIQTSHQSTYTLRDNCWHTV